MAMITIWRISLVYQILTIRQFVQGLFLEFLSTIHFPPCLICILAHLGTWCDLATDISLRHLYVPYRECLMNMYIGHPICTSAWHSHPVQDRFHLFIIGSEAYLDNGTHAISMCIGGQAPVWYITSTFIKLTWRRPVWVFPYRLHPLDVTNYRICTAS